MGIPRGADPPTDVADRGGVPGDGSGTVPMSRDPKHLFDTFTH